MTAGTPGSWSEVSKAAPCPICGKPDWCGRSDDGAVRCMRIADPPAGWRVVKRNADGGTVFRRDDEPNPQLARSSGPKPAPKQAKSAKTWPTLEAAIAAAARSTGGEHVATWTYRDGGDTRDLMHVSRFNLGDGSKQFRPIHLNGAGYVLGDPPGMLPLYALPTLHGVSTVYVTEGEKAADAARSIGLTATTSAHGSKSAAKTDWQPLAGKDVVILPDADAAGEHYAATVAEILTRQGCTVRIVHLPDLPPGGDVHDYIEARECVESETIRAGIEALANAAPEWQSASLNNRHETGNSEPITVRLSDVKPEPLRWLWPGRIPSGKLSLICGDPNGGKTFLTLDMAARVSRGTPWPDRRDEPNPAGDVLLLSAEDDPADTIVPRLMAAGADLNRIRMMQGVKRNGSGKASFFSLSVDVGALERVADTMPNLRMIVIDPVSAYMGGDTDSHKNADVRGVLGPLAELASRRNIAVVVVTHLSKGAGGRAMYRAIGSIAFIAAARAAWAVVRDPDDETRRRRGMLPIKLNIAAEASGIAFTIEPATVNGIDTAAVHWESEPLDAKADEWIAAEQSNADDEERGARQDAAEWLRAALADGPVPANEIKTQATANSISVATLRRAMTDANAESVKLSYFDKTWYWRIKGDERGPRCSRDAQDAHVQGVSALGENERLGSEDDPWTVARFVTRFIGSEPAEKRLIVARARKAGVARQEIIDLLALAIGDSTVHQWTINGSRAIWLATVPQPTAEQGDAA